MNNIASTALGRFISANASEQILGYQIASSGNNIGALAPVRAQTPVVAAQTLSGEYFQGYPVVQPLTVDASVTDGGTLSYQWYSNTVNSSKGGAIISGANSANYSPSADTDGTFFYYCVVTNTNANAITQTASGISSVYRVLIRHFSEASVFLDTNGGLQNIPYSNLESALASTAAAGTYTIKIAANQTLPPHELTTAASTAKNITLIANNAPVEILLSSAGSLFSIGNSNTGSSVTLAIGNGITLRGRANNTSPLIMINARGVFNMGEGSLITANRNAGTSNFGSGVSNSGVFTMTGGEISENIVNIGEGAGVYVTSTGVTNIGGTAKIINNTRGTGTDASNLFLVSGRTVTLGNGSSVPLPAAGMQVGVSSSAVAAVVVNNAANGQEQYFSSDNANTEVIWQDNAVRLVMPLGLRLITIDMFDSQGDGWDGNGALRIIVNGVLIANNAKVFGSRSSTNGVNVGGGSSANTYKFVVKPNDVVQIIWTAGSAQGENSFIVYYDDTPPVPAFAANNNNTWDGENAIIFGLRGGMNDLTTGVLLLSFTVE